MKDALKLPGLFSLLGQSFVEEHVLSMWPDEWGASRVCNGFGVLDMSNPGLETQRISTHSHYISSSCGRLPLPYGTLQGGFCLLVN